MHARAWGLVAGIRSGRRASQAERRIRVAAVAVALLSQTVFWATYYYVTGGCLCAVTGAPGPPTDAWIYPTLRLASGPALWPNVPLPVGLVSGTLLNLAAWMAGVYAVLKAVQALQRTAASLRARSTRPHGRR